MYIEQHLAEGGVVWCWNKRYLLLVKLKKFGIKQKEFRLRAVNGRFVPLRGLFFKAFAIYSEHNIYSLKSSIEQYFARQKRWQVNIWVCICGVRYVRGEHQMLRHLCLVVSYLTLWLHSEFIEAQKWGDMGGKGDECVCVCDFCGFSGDNFGYTRDKECLCWFVCLRYGRARYLRYCCSCLKWRKQRRESRSKQNHFTWLSAFFLLKMCEYGVGPVVCVRAILRNRTLPGNETDVADECGGWIKYIQAVEIPPPPPRNGRHMRIADKQSTIHLSPLKPHFVRISLRLSVWCVALVAFMCAHKCLSCTVCDVCWMCFWATGSHISECWFVCLLLGAQ